jgi:hypothetical protein
MGMNTCDCPTPPGGRVQCGERQLAICRRNHTDEITVAECHDLPEALHTTDASQLRDWAWEIITNGAPGLFSVSGDGSGSFRSDDGVYTITFQLPRAMPTASATAAPAAG